MDIMNFSKANCMNCYKCVRNCPVKAIKYSDNQATIMEDRCIYCGICFVVCPQEARHIQSDMSLLKAAVEEGKEVVALIAPSFAGFYENYGGFVEGLRRIGFSKVMEVAYGAEQVTESYRKKLEEGNLKYAISTCCPSINYMIRKYYPETVQYLLPSVSPMIALGKAIKEKNRETYTVFIGPCLSKKREAMDPEHKGIIDAVLTFEEIMPYFKSCGLDIEDLPASVPNLTATRKGRGYPLSAGIGEGLKDTLLLGGYDRISTHGSENVKELLGEIMTGELDKAYIELSSCVESCINGPCIPKDSGNIFKRKQRIKHFMENGWGVLGEENVEQNIDLTLEQDVIKSYLYSPEEEEIVGILRSMGKTSRKDELNCGACGYNSCREKAKSVLEGMSEIEMCMPYMRMKAEQMNDIIFFNSPNLILILDEYLEIKLLNPAAQEVFNKKKGDLAGIPLEYIMDDREIRESIKAQKEVFTNRVHHLETDRIFMQSTIHLKDTHQIIIIMSDVTQEEKRRLELKRMKEHTLKVTQEVIDKQMRISQEIASLLGETTAETKVALNNLKSIVIKESE